MSSFRLEISNTVKDTRAQQRLKKLTQHVTVENVALTDVYTINKSFTDDEKKQIGQMLINPLFEAFTLDLMNAPANFNYAIEIGFLPGVTDNLGTTVVESIEDLLKVKFNRPEEDVYSSQITFLTGNLTREDVEKIAASLANPLIQSIRIMSKEELENEVVAFSLPKVELNHQPKADEVNLEVSDEELLKIGKEGIANADGTRRGPLALSLEYLKVIRDYFRTEGRNPTDLELEAIAQTWSEHCKHTIFANPLDEIENGIYKHYIKRATQDIRKAKGENDFCVSVFTDNSGAIEFNNEYLVTDKVETHNSPAALDPFGAAVTGIVGVNRDTIGFGKGAKPIINRYGFCFGDPDDKRKLYRGKNKTNPALSPKQVMDGVIAGVYAGGNESGIPTPQGFMYFEDRYRGKPLVFVGTVGLIPRSVNGKNSAEKQARPGDKIVVAGGRVGLDGIHGATFSSEAMDTGSPATAVQIGDPITQKKMSDAIVKEIRDQGLYSSITDCGAGGISCSVAEMARECGGCRVDLEKVPLKYPNLSPWEIWISESQERMTMAVPPENVDTLLDILSRRGVEARVIGEFADDGRCRVDYNGAMVMDTAMEFLHDGLPKTPQQSSYIKITHEEPDFPCPENLNETMLQMISRKNIASTEFLSLQYDHNVQGGSVIKPLHGKGRVNSAASVTRPVLTSNKGVVLSQALNPTYSDIDTYHMAASAIDTAIRQAVAVGANVDHLALLDNFCWCSSDESERLGQLKEAARACYDSATAFGTPYISGKDSMFNDFKGFDENDNPVKISVPPTLLISSIGVIEDVQSTVTLDVKFPGDLIYILGETKNELGGSEYFAMHHFIGNTIPQVDAKKSLNLYRRFYQAVQKNLIVSAISPAIGGLGVTLMKMSVGGQLGIEVDLGGMANDGVDRNDLLLFSESQSRFAVSVNPENQSAFEEIFPEAKLVGKVREDERFVIRGANALQTRSSTIVDLRIEEIGEAYRDTFQNC